jgi:hypothetical protein
MCALDRVSVAQLPGCAVSSMRALVHDLCHLDRVDGHTPAERLWNALGRHDRMVYLTGSITLLSVALLCLRWALGANGSQRATELHSGYGHPPGFGYAYPGYAGYPSDGVPQNTFTGYGLAGARPWAHPPPPMVDAHGYPIGWQPVVCGADWSDYHAQRATM